MSEHTFMVVAALLVGVLAGLGAPGNFRGLATRDMDCGDTGLTAGRTGV